MLNLLKIWLTALHGHCQALPTQSCSMQADNVWAKSRTLGVLKIPVIMAKADQLTKTSLYLV